MISQPSRASGCPRQSFLYREKNHATRTCPIFFAKYRMTASSVPIWVTAVNAAPGSSHPASAAVIRRCALDEIGRNSVSP